MKKLMSEKEFRETNWIEVFKEFSKLSKEEQNEIDKKALKDLDKMLKI